jgi:hypothetical protein
MEYVYLLYFLQLQLFCINPLIEFCYIHLNFMAVDRHHEFSQQLL